MWWRACAVWRSRIVSYLGVLLIALTLGMSYPSRSISACCTEAWIRVRNRRYRTWGPRVPLPPMPMSLPELPVPSGDILGDLCGALVGNKRARHNPDRGQGLVRIPVVVRGYTDVDVDSRTRQHRSMLRGHSDSKRKARIAKAFFLLLESGTIYSILMVRSVNSFVTLWAHSYTFRSCWSCTNSGRVDQIFPFSPRRMPSSRQKRTTRTAALYPSW